MAFSGPPGHARAGMHYNRRYMHMMVGRKCSREGSRLMCDHLVVAEQGQHNNLGSSMAQCQLTQIAS